MYGIDAAIIKHHNCCVNLMDSVVMRMPYPPYYTYPLGPFIRYSVALALVLGLILPVLQLTKEIVYDREKKLKVIFNSYMYLVIPCFVLPHLYTLMNIIHQLFKIDLVGTKSYQLFISPKRKAQVSFSDQTLSVVRSRRRCSCRKLFTISSSSPEPQGQFQLNFAQSILG